MNETNNHKQHINVIRDNSSISIDRLVQDINIKTFHPENVNNKDNINSLHIKRHSVEFEDIYNTENGVKIPVYISNDDESESTTFTASSRDIHNMREIHNERKNYQNDETEP
eukprot:414080_1